MDPLQLLHLRYDGPIPEELRRAAMAACLDLPREPITVRVKSYTPAGQIDRMAETMRLAARRRGRAYREDLHEAGFSEREIDRYAADARALAARRAIETGEDRATPDIPVAALLAAARILQQRSDAR